MGCFRVRENTKVPKGEGLMYEDLDLDEIDALIGLSELIANGDITEEELEEMAREFGDE